MLCVKVELEHSVKVQLLERVARHCAGELGTTALAFLALILQLQRSDGLPAKVLDSTLAGGCDIFIQALPRQLDCGNFLALVVEACVLRVALASEAGDSGDADVFLEGLLADASIVDSYASPIALALLQAFQKACLDRLASEEEQHRLASVLQKPLSAIGARQPLALSAALTKTVEVASARGASTELLAKVLAPATSNGSLNVEVSEGEIVDVIRAFSSTVVKTRRKAVQSAVADLQRSEASEAETPRQKMLVSLLLQAAQDRHIDVARKTLETQVLWSSLPQARATTTIPFLLSFIETILPDSQISGESVGAMFKSSFFGNERVMTLLPLLFRCFSLVYCRIDCDEALRRSVDLSLLPLVVFCGVGFDFLASAGSSEDVESLCTCLFEFCEASENNLLASFKSGSKASKKTSSQISKKLIQSLDISGVIGLCNLAEGRPWETVSADQSHKKETPAPLRFVLGGKAAQIAAVAFLSEALPTYFDSLAKDSSDVLEQAVIRCASACECFARHLSLMPSSEGDGSTHLSKLSQVVVSGITRIDTKTRGSGKSGSTGSAKKSKRLSRAGSSGTAPLQQAVVNILRVALERPKEMSAVSRGVLTSTSIVQPALLNLALAPDRHSGSLSSARNRLAVTANALLLLHSLLSATDADQWSLDQGLLAPLMAKLASTDAPEIRSIIIRLFELFRKVGWKQFAAAWDTPCAISLREAGITREHHELMSASGWAAVDESSLNFAGLSEKSFNDMLDLFCAHKDGILQDRSAAATVLSKFLTKGQKTPRAKEKECAFWFVSLSMLLPVESVQSSPLLSAVPISGFFAGLKESLRKSLDEMVSKLGEKGAQPEAPALVKVVALKVADNTSGGRLPENLSEKARSAVAKVVTEFVEELVLPVCTGLSSYYKKGSGPLPEAVVDLACVLIAGLPDALRAQYEDSKRMPAGIAEEVLKLCIAAAPAQKDDEKETSEASAPSIFATAHSTFASLPIGADLLCEMLKSFGPKLNKMDAKCRHVACEAVYQRILALDRTFPGTDSLLLELSELALQQAKLVSSADDAPALFALLAVAALCEHMGALATSENKLSTCIGTACGRLDRICDALGKNFSSGALAALVRACNALIPLLKTQEATPPPIGTCIKALAKYPDQIAPYVLGLLKTSLWQFWRFPKGAEALDDASLAKQEGLSQSRIRLLLHAMVARCPGLLSDVTPDLCVSLSRCTGINASLDFAVILVLVRKVPTEKARKPPIKRRASQREEDIAEEIFGIAATNDDEVAVDEAIAVFTSNALLNRFHGVGTLAQTISCLAFELCQPGCSRNSYFWGASLLPESFVQDVGKDRSIWVVAMCLSTMHRLIEEHGLPEGLDDVKVAATSYRGVSSLGDASDAGEIEKATAALALCYVVKATCVIEALLGSATKLEGPNVALCKERARHLRQLLLRSLAVNHPHTFFQCVCFGLQIEGLSPVMEKGDILAKKEFALAEVSLLLTSASEALRKHRELTSPESGIVDAEDLKERQSSCAPLCTAALQCVCERYVLAERSATKFSESMYVTIWRFLEGLCQFSARAAPKPVLQLCVPAIAKCLQSVASATATRVAVQEGVACCQCFLTAVEELGKAVLPGLTQVLPPLMDVVQKGAVVTKEGSREQSESASLESHAIQVLQALIKKVGSFMSPHLERILVVLSAQAPPHRVQLLQSLGSQAIATVPHRLLLPAVQSAVTSAANQLAGDADIDATVVCLQRLAVMQVRIFSVSAPEFVSTNAEAAISNIVRVMSAGSTAASRFLRMDGRQEELPMKIMRRELERGAPLVVDVEQLQWGEWCSDSSVLRMIALAAAAFTQLSLRLSIDDLKPRFVKILDWSRNNQTQALAKQSTRKASEEVDEFADTDEACRVLSLCSLMHCLACEAPDISEELFLPLASKDLVSCLGAARRQALRLAAQQRQSSKRRKRGLAGADVKAVRSSAVLHEFTWWWFEVMQATLGFVSQSLKHAGGLASQTKVVDETVEAFVDPVSEALSVLEFMPAIEDSDLTRSLVEAIQRALVVLAAASDGQRIKRLFSAVLMKTRSEDSELRLAAVKACHRIWADIGVQAVSGLSEVLMYAVELLEDEDPRVETAVRSMVKTMEGCTGESLQDHLKR